MLSFLPLKTTTGAVAGLLRVEDGVCTLSLRQPFSGECTLLLAGDAAASPRSDAPVAAPKRTVSDKAARTAPRASASDAAASPRSDAPVAAPKRTLSDKAVLTAPRASASDAMDTQGLRAISIQPGARIRVESPVVAAIGTIHGAPAFFGAVDGCPFPLSDLLYRLSLQKPAAAKPSTAPARSSSDGEPKPSPARSSADGEPNLSPARSSADGEPKPSPARSSADGEPNLSPSRSSADGEPSTAPARSSAADVPRRDASYISWDGHNATDGNRAPVSRAEKANASDKNRADVSHAADANASNKNRSDVSCVDDAAVTDGNRARVSRAEDANTADGNRAVVSCVDDAAATGGNRSAVENTEEESATGRRAQMGEALCDGPRIAVPRTRDDGRAAQTPQDAREPHDTVRTENASFAATLHRAARVYADALCDPLASFPDGDPRYGSADEAGLPDPHHSLIAHAHDTYAPERTRSTDGLADEAGAPPPARRCHRPAASRAAPSPWTAEVDALLRDK